MTFDDTSSTPEDIQALRRVLPQVKAQLRQAAWEITKGNIDLSKVDALLDERFGFMQLQLGKGLELSELLRELFPDSFDGFLPDCPEA